MSYIRRHGSVAALVNVEDNIRGYIAVAADFKELDIAGFSCAVECPLSGIFGNIRGEGRLCSLGESGCGFCIVVLSGAVLFLRLLKESFFAGAGFESGFSLSLDLCGSCLLAGGKLLVGLAVFCGESLYCERKGSCINCVICAGICIVDSLDVSVAVRVGKVC